MALLPYSNGIPNPLPVSRGGTGSSTKSFVDLSSNQSSIGGNKGFTGYTSFAASTASQASINIAPGVSPGVNSVAGDIMYYSSNFVFNVNGNLQFLVTNTSTTTLSNKLFSDVVSANANNTVNLGKTNAYFLNGYVTTLNLNSTASINGSTAGQISLVSGAAAGGGYAVYVNPTTLTSTTANQAGIELISTFSPTASASGRSWGLQFNVGTSGSNAFTNNTGAVTGIEGFALHGGSATATQINGALLYAQSTSTGTVTNAVGIWGYGIQSLGGGTITNAYNIKISDAYINGGGSIGTSYGLYIGSMQAATTNYAIYTNTGKVHFGDNTDWADAKNLSFGTTTGTQIGTATTQKLAHYGATPVVQPSAAGTATGYAAGTTVATFHSDDTYTGNTGTTGYTINGIVAALKNLGLLAA